MTRRRLDSILLVLLAGLVPLLVPAPAGAWVPANQASTLHVDGLGYGHGRGMSQWGAKYRADAGQTWQQILAFYYPGTTWGTFTADVKVLISKDTDKDTVVRPRDGLRIFDHGHRVVTVLPTTLGATRWRLDSVPDGRTRLSYHNGAWRAWRILKGTGEFRAPGPITLAVPGAQRTYRGYLRYVGLQQPRGQRTVNVLPIDRYLLGVVPGEMPALWEPDAVRSQAVAARTYALNQRQARLGKPWEICDTTACQVYGGAAVEHPASTDAVVATLGTYLVHDGKPAFTQFSASNGGMTVYGGTPYLPAQADPLDTYPAWRKDVSPAALQKKCPATHPTLKRVQVSARDGRGGAWGGRALTVDLECYAGGVGKVVRLPATDVRTLLGLKSTWFEFAAQ